MRLNTNSGNRPEHVIITVKNSEASASIPAGSPVVYVMNGTDDGFGVVKPSTSASLLKILSFQAGVTTRAIAAGDVGEALVYGFTNTLLLIRQTRTASTTDWLTEAARSVGEQLSIDTTNNGFVTANSIVSAETLGSTTMAGILTLTPLYALAQSLASYASSGSATSDTRTAITATVKAFIRLM